MTKRTETSRLRALARMHGVLTSYVDVQGHRTTASDVTLRALLAALGVPADSPEECAEALHRALRQRATGLADDVLVAWNGLLTHIDLSLNDMGGGPLPELHIVLGDGAIVNVDIRRCRVAPLGGVGSSHGGLHRVWLPEVLELPTGYHQVVCSMQGRQESSLLLAAPVRCYGADSRGERHWGLFAPLYALRSSTDCGTGSYSELQALCRYTAHMGGGLVGTLPLLPGHYEEGNEPSPYLPLTRLLWSEFYVDISRIPFVESCPEARDVLNSSEVQEARAALRQASLVDYVAVQQFRRSVGRSVYQRLASSSALQSGIDGFLSGNPHAARYAAFRATRDSLQAPWQQWPPGPRDGDIDERLYDVGEKRFHEFEQWLAHEQMDGCVEHAGAQGVGLYLDLPVGVHPDGYDTWHFRDAFVTRAATGAPPDIVFTMGQKWGSPPLHPVTIRRRQYDYVRAYLEHHMRAARVLRIDHVMGLHRIFCIPDGADPAMGAYLRYRPDEWYAILSIESHRHKTVLVGEDLGLVPAEVRRSMSRHGLSRMFVLYYELDGIAAGRTPSMPSNCLASVNTHDMPSFAAMYEGIDIGQHVRLGLVKPGEAPSLRKGRRKAMRAFLKLLDAVCPGIATAQGIDDVLGCTVGWLGAGRARYVVVNLEDLWHETAQQNVPGVGMAYPSWRHRAACTLEEIWRSPHMARALETLRSARRGAQRWSGGE